MSLPALGARPTAAGAAAGGTSTATPAAGGAAADAPCNDFAALLAGLGDALDATLVNDPCAAAVAIAPVTEVPAGDPACAAAPPGAVPDPLAGMALLMAQYAPVAPATLHAAGGATAVTGPNSMTDATLTASASATPPASLAGRPLPAGTGTAAAAMPGADLPGTGLPAPRSGPGDGATPTLPSGAPAVDAQPLPAATDAQATLQAVPDIAALMPGWAAAPATAAVQGPAAAGPVYQAELPSRPGEAAFAGDLAAQVSVLVEGGFQQAQLRLNPSELGPIHIQLSVSAHTQTADISFSAVHGLTRECIEQALPELREMLQAQGLSLGETGVSGGQQQGTGGRDSAPAAAQRARGGGLSADDGMQAAADLAGPRRAARGMLDLYA